MLDVVALDQDSCAVELQGPARYGVLWRMQGVVGAGGLVGGSPAIRVVENLKLGSCPARLLVRLADAKQDPTVASGCYSPLQYQFEISIAPSGYEIASFTSMFEKQQAVVRSPCRGRFVSLESSPSTQGLAVEE